MEKPLQESLISAELMGIADVGECVSNTVKHRGA
jgi:hypothetical protein